MPDQDGLCHPELESHPKLDLIPGHQMNMNHVKVARCEHQGTWWCFCRVSTRTCFTPGPSLPLMMELDELEQLTMVQEVDSAIGAQWGHQGGTRVHGRHGAACQWGCGAGLCPMSLRRSSVHRRRIWSRHLFAACMLQLSSLIMQYSHSI